MDNKYSIATLLHRMKKNWPQSVNPECEIALGIIRLNDIIADKAKKTIDHYDLTTAGFEVLSTLRALSKPRQLTPTELYKSILITSGGMTKVLKQLEQRKLIERIDNPEDGRSKFVKLTDKGAKLAEKVMAAVNRSDQELLGQSLNQEERAHLRDILINALTKLEAD